VLSCIETYCFRVGNDGRDIGIQTRRWNNRGYI
jgi:hypothetical protein